MLTLLGNLDSGNVHKVAMVLFARGLAYRRVDVSQVRDEPRHPKFLALNPIGKIPALVLENGDCLSESGAILFWLAQDTPLWPQDVRTQTEVLRWMFFEQYSHEPALAVLRYLRQFAPEVERDALRIRELETRSHRALAVLERRLETLAWVAAAEVTMADHALYPYTKWSDEAGVDLAAYPAVRRWIDRFEARSSFLPLRQEGARQVISFEDYFGA